MVDTPVFLPRSSYRRIALQRLGLKVGWKGEISRIMQQVSLMAVSDLLRSVHVLNSLSPQELTKLVVVFKVRRDMFDTLFGDTSGDLPLCLKTKFIHLYP